MPKKNKLGERKRRVMVRDGDRLTLADKNGNDVMQIEFRGSEFLLTVNIIGGDSRLTAPVGLVVDPTLLGHTWQDEE
jgi:hypothetical protein